MAYNEKLAARVREMLHAEGVNPISEKKMVGGLCFMVRGNMCVVVRSDSLLLRLDPDVFQKAVAEKKLDPMLRIGRTMTGFGYVDEGRLKTRQQLHHWIGLALQCNERLPPPKKKHG